MNIVKLQDSLKDLSDRQLMQTMQGGSAPQYLVLAEMQRRKKTRESAAQQSPQPESSVAEGIISGIAAVPTAPMQMAEGGLVSFAKGGSTGRAKGEDEACWTDSRTGEKYCPPSRPQIKMPRTGQRKTFQEGGGVNGMPPEEMAEMDRRLNAKNYFEQNRDAILSAVPGTTVDDVYNALYNPGQAGYEALEQAGVMPASDTSTTPALASSNPQPESTTAGEEEQPGLFRRSGRLLGRAATSTLEDVRDYVYDPFAKAYRIYKGTFYAPAGRALYQGLGGIGEGVAGLYEGATGREVSPQVEELIEYVKDPYQAAAERAAAGRAAAREQAEREQAEQQEDEGEQDRNDFDTSGGKNDDPPEPTETPREDGLMELMRELQSEKRESREGLRDRAINEALIRGGLTMAASKNPDFLAAAAEGGIGGLAGYQGAMERAAERQGEISSDMSDLIIAREANDIRRQAADASMAKASVTARRNQISALQDMLESEQKAIIDGYYDTQENQEAKANAITRIEQIRATLRELQGFKTPSGPAEGRADPGFDRGELQENT